MVAGGIDIRRRAEIPEAAGGQAGTGRTVFSIDNEELNIEFPAQLRHQHPHRLPAALADDIPDEQQIHQNIRSWRVCLIFGSSR